MYKRQIQIDPDYEPAAIERKQIYGVTFEQGHNNLEINNDMLRDIVTKNRELPESAKMDLLISLITLKYTQSNSCLLYTSQYSSKSHIHRRSSSPG